MAAARTHRQPEVIDLSSDDSELSVTPAADRRQQVPVDYDSSDDEADDLFDRFTTLERTPPARSVAQNVARPSLAPQPSGQFVNIDGEDVFIPDEDIAPANMRSPQQGALMDLTFADGPQERSGLATESAHEEFTVDTCLRKVLEIFPDINHDHVFKLYNDFDSNEGYENLSGEVRFDNIVEGLLSTASYPKQERGRSACKKRKRADSIDEDANKKWELNDRDPIPGYLVGSIRAMLKADFPEVPQQYIQRTLAREMHLYKAYIALANDRDTFETKKVKPYGKGRPTAGMAPAETIAENSGLLELVEELMASRARVATIRAEHAVALAKKEAEEENIAKAMERGETAECSACFDDLPMNRQVHCDGEVAHFTCFGCIETYIKSEVGEARCRVLCPAGCGAAFAHSQLDQLEDKELLERLAELEQEKAIRDAGLDNLEECVFCDYKCIMPPIEEDFEFRCANPECEKVSCRRCKAVSHIPISCEQYAKDNKINSRHKIEEAMTAALIRNCNKCKKAFIKEYGCNKMTCPSCQNLQCYVCSESLKNYDHFDSAPGRAVNGATAKKCPLYDNVEERHEREVKAAEEAARADVVAENPDVTLDDLEFKLSDAVKKSTANRIAQGNVYGGAIPELGMMYDRAMAPAVRAQADAVRRNHLRNLVEENNLLVRRALAVNQAELEPGQPAQQPPAARAAIQHMQAQQQQRVMQLAARHMERRELLRRMADVAPLPPPPNPPAALPRNPPMLPAYMAVYGGVPFGGPMPAVPVAIAAPPLEHADLALHDPYNFAGYGAAYPWAPVAPGNPPMPGAYPMAAPPAAPAPDDQLPIPDWLAALPPHDPPNTAPGMVDRHMRLQQLALRMDHQRDAIETVKQRRAHADGRALGRAAR